MTDNADNNIVEFPKHKIIRDPIPDIEEIKKMKKKSVRNLADNLANEICDSLITDFDNYGIDTEKDSFVKDFVFLSSIVSATIYRTLEIDHELHEFIDTMVNVVEIDKEKP